jgi:hypothetical protein
MRARRYPQSRPPAIVLARAEKLAKATFVASVVWNGRPLMSDPMANPAKRPPKRARSVAKAERTRTRFIIPHLGIPR